jgi:DNA invertase Pin-like site-specific DNA recombinase
MSKHIAYFRVSTEGQGRSGLGLDAQRAAVTQHLGRVGGELIASFTEIETGKRNDRPELAKALELCRKTGAVLIIAKLDRLARNAHFLLGVVEGAGEGGVVFCDLPHIPAGPVGKFMITQMAAVAELEAGLISQRTKAALAQAKARGVKLGNPNGLSVSRPDLGTAARVAKAKAFAASVQPTIAALRAEGLSLEAIAGRLNEQHIQTSRGASWTATAVRRVLERPA